MKERRRVRALRGHQSMINAVAFAPDGRLASCSSDYTIKFWDPAADQELTRLAKRSVGQAENAVFGPNGSLLAFSQPNTKILFFGPIRTITVVDADVGRIVRTLAGHQRGTVRLAFSHDGTRLASGGRLGDVKVWDTSSWGEVGAFSGHDGEITALALSPDGRWGASAHEPKEITQIRIKRRIVAGAKSVPVALKVWDAKAGSERFTLAGHFMEIDRVAFSPDGQLLASAAYKLVKIWDMETGSLLRELTSEFQSGMIEVLMFSPDGTLLVTAGSGSVQVWDVASGRSVVALQGHGRGRLVVAFSPDGARLATSTGGEVKLWEVRTGQEILTLSLSPLSDTERPAVVALAWSSDGERLRAALRDGSVVEWDGTARARE
ncbi:MAG TPA: WD40 repeat domain-containing protein [Pirellulales bacterium]|nr:WD40 repeat domain-containing protein [Pirellulales bacterium]